MNISIELLKNYKIFKNINNEDLKKFLSIISIKQVESDVNIIQEGSVEDRLIFLFDGNCSVSMPLTLKSKLLKEDDSVKEVFKASSKDFPVFGEVFLGESKQRTANIKTTSKSVIGLIESNDFFALCDQDNSLGYKVMKNLVDMMCDRFERNSKTVLKLSTAISLLLEK